MKKILMMTVAFVACLSVNATAGLISNGQTVTCKDANSITLEVAMIANVAQSDQHGYTANDRGTANLVVWKSSNFTTVPITLGPNDDNATTVGTDGGRTGLSSRGPKGASKVVLKKETAFSRGDSIGDISGVVKITNTGTNPATVTCN